MNRERYLFLINWAKTIPEREKIICGLTKWIPITLGLFYVCSIAFCFLFHPIGVFRLLVRPFTCFCFVTVLRNLIKAPRPYDVFDYVPLCGYHPGKNRSFPSRHTASAVILALEMHLLWGGAFGLFCIVLSIIMGICRILCGNHFIKDVVVGCLIAIMFNCV